MMARTDAPSEAATVLRDLELAVQAGLGAETAGAVADFAARIRADQTQRIVEWANRQAATAAWSGEAGMYRRFAEQVAREFGATPNAE